MSIYGGPGSGLDYLTNQAFKTIYNNVNDELVAISNNRLTIDQELDTLRGRAYASVMLESFPSANMHYGHRPSLIQAPVEQYPNISVMAYQSVPDSMQLDNYSQTVASLMIELMVKGTEQEGEEVVNKRATRSCDAVYNVLNRDEILSPSFLNVQSPASMNITDLFVRRKEKGQGEIFLWQGARLEYKINVISNPENSW